MAQARPADNPLGERSLARGRMLHHRGGVSDSSAALKYDALTRQLERARAMQTAYFSRFFSWIILTGFTFVILYLVPYPAAQALLPFWVVTAGVQASFYLHFVDFARVRAADLERRLNLLLGEKLFLEAVLEADYFYPMEKPKLGGVILSQPASFFSAYTVHWLFLWSFFFLFGALAAWQALAGYRLFYAVLLASWAALNVGYVSWYFLGHADESRIARRLRDGTAPSG
jgi:hypothetical protein